MRSSDELASARCCVKENSSAGIESTLVSVANLEVSNLILLITNSAYIIMSTNCTFEFCMTSNEDSISVCF